MKTLKITQAELEQLKVAIDFRMEDYINLDYEINKAFTPTRKKERELMNICHLCETPHDKLYRFADANICLNCKAMVTKYRKSDGDINQGKPRKVK
jgi:hypothetical protein